MFLSVDNLSIKHLCKALHTKLMQECLITNKLVPVFWSYSSKGRGFVEQISQNLYMAGSIYLLQINIFYKCMLKEFERQI